MLQTHAPSQWQSRRAWVGASLGTMASVFPAFLTGAMAVQLRSEVGLSVTDVGFALGSFFAAAAVFSAPMGRVGQWLGPQTALRVGLSASSLSMVLLAALANRPLHFFLLLTLSGTANALNQPSANLLLASEIHPGRMGMAMAVKQSGMPVAALLGGLAVPALALTFGWESAYIAGAAVAAVAVTIPPAALGDDASDARAAKRKATAPDLPLRLLGLYSLVGLLGAAIAGAMVAFLTSGAEASGVGEGSAGLVLALGSLAGVASRLFQGWEVDTRQILPIERLVLLYTLGAVGVAAFAIHTPTSYALAAIPAFGFGWAWPGLFNLSVIRRNPSAPASATGISQVGVFIGAGSGPVLGGIIVEQFGYQTLWIIGSVCLLTGSLVARYLRVALRRHG